MMFGRRGCGHAGTRHPPAHLFTSRQRWGFFSKGRDGAMAAGQLQITQHCAASAYSRPLRQGGTFRGFLGAGSGGGRLRTNVCYLRRSKALCLAFCGDGAAAGSWEGKISSRRDSAAKSFDRLPRSQRDGAAFAGELWRVVYSGRASMRITVSWRQAGRAALSSSARPDWRQVTGWTYPKETADVFCASGSCGSRWRETHRRSSGSRGMRALPRINRPGSQSLRTVAN